MESNQRNGKTYSEAGKLGFEKSKKTLYHLKQKRIEAYLTNANHCRFCNTMLDYLDRTKKFCNQSCSARFYNESRKIKISCKYCNKPINGANNRQFCSKKCKWSLVRQKNLLRWQQGKDKGWTGKTICLKNWIRDFLIIEEGEKCSICSWSQINIKTKEVPLQIHHKDGDAKNCSKENLQVLCPNCHSLTENFGRRNKVSSRAERYA